MIVVGIFLAIFLLGVTLVLVYRDQCYAWQYSIGQFLIGAGLLFAILFLFICIPLTRQNDFELIASYNVMKAMLAEARSTNSVDTIERAAIMTDVFKLNEKIEYAQRWNSSQWDLWHPDEIMKLEPLK